MSTQGPSTKEAGGVECVDLTLDERQAAAAQQQSEPQAQAERHEQQAQQAQQKQPSKFAKAGTSAEANHILLLYHAKKCTLADDDDQCPFNRHCAEMKRTWRHMAECTDNNCLFPHCYTSRVLLSHFRRCKDARCPVCGPVRKTIQQDRKMACTPAPPTKETIQQNRAMQMPPFIHETWRKNDQLNKAPARGTIKAPSRNAIQQNYKMQMPPFIHETWRGKGRSKKGSKLEKRFVMDTDTQISEIVEEVEEMTIEETGEH